PGSPETRLVESGLRGLTLLACLVHRLELRRRDVSDRAEKPAVVEPVDPLERGELDILEVAPRPVRADQLRLVEPVDRLGESVVVRVADAADRGCDPRLRQPLGVANRQVLHATIAVMNEIGNILAVMERLLERVERQVAPE